MRKPFIIVAMLAATATLVAVPSVIAGKHNARVIAQNTANHGRSKVAVAQALGVLQPGNMSLRVTTRPAHEKVAWIYTVRCLQDGRFYQYPPPGGAKDTKSVTPFTIPMKTGGATHPDTCDVAASAKLDYHVGKSVSVQILDDR